MTKICNHLEKEMATHSSVLAWMAEPDGLPSMGSHRVGHDWGDLAASGSFWPHAKSWLIGKDSDAGRDWGQEKKGTTEDEMAGWHHGLDGHESEWTPGVGDGQGDLVCSDSWGCKELDMTEWLNWTELRIILGLFQAHVDCSIGFKTFSFLFIGDAPCLWWVLAFMTLVIKFKTNKFLYH